MKHFHFHHRTRHLWKDNLRLFESSVLLHVLGRSLVDVFIPVLMLTKGYGVSDVIWYYAFYNAIDVPLNFLAGRLVRGIGAVRTIALGTVAGAGFLIFLNGLVPHSWLALVALAAVAALYDTCYWVGHLYLFSQAEEKASDASADTGTLYAIRILGGMAGPIVGAGLLVFDGQGVLIVASVAVLLASLVPLLRMSVPHDRPRQGLTPFRSFFRDRRERYNYGSLLLYCFHDAAETTLLPLFIYSAFGTYESVALLAVIVALTSAGLSRVTGRLSRFHPTSMIAWGSLCIGIVWLVRIAFPSPDLYYASLVATGFLALVTSIPMEGGVLGRARDVDPLSAMVYRNAATMLSPFILFLALGLLIDVFHVGFAAAAASMFALAFFSGIALMRDRRAGRVAA